MKTLKLLNKFRNKYAQESDDDLSATQQVMLDFLRKNPNISKEEEGEVPDLEDVLKELSEEQNNILNKILDAVPEAFRDDEDVVDFIDHIFTDENTILSDEEQQDWIKSLSNQVKERRMWDTKDDPNAYEDMEDEDMEDEDMDPKHSGPFSSIDEEFEALQEYTIPAESYVIEQQFKGSRDTWPEIIQLYVGDEDNGFWYLDKSKGKYLKSKKQEAIRINKSDLEKQKNEMKKQLETPIDNWSRKQRLAHKFESKLRK